MNVASLELCKELYELSGWDNTLAGARERWIELPNNSWDCLRLSDVEANGFDKQLWFSGISAYDLGYLLRKLPARYWQENEKRWDALHITKWDRLQNGGIVYTAEYWTVYNAPFKVEADTPEDAAVKLAIELFKQGVLTKEGL